jgi:hypothetical protein
MPLARRGGYSREGFDWEITPVYGFVSNDISYLKVVSKAPSAVIILKNQSGSLEIFVNSS